MEAPPAPAPITRQGPVDPLTFLDPYERALCGWAVVRMFATCTPRFAKALNKYGTEGMAYYACIKTFYFYGFPLMLLSWATALWLDLYYSCFVLIGICWVLGTRRIFSMRRAGKAFRRARDASAALYAGSGS